MAGKIHEMINTLLDKAGKEDNMLRYVIRTKLILQGVNSDIYGKFSEDDPEVMEIVRQLASGYNIYYDPAKDQQSKSIITAYSSKETLSEALKDISIQCLGFRPSFVLFFSSTVFDPYKTALQMQELFPGVPTMGCTTAGELVTGIMLKNSLVAMLFSEQTISDIKIAVIDDIKGKADVSAAFSSLEKHFNVSMREMDYKKYVGIILHDGLSGSEEKVMEKIGRLSNVMFVGGSAGDDLKFNSTFVFENGKARSNASVVALLKPAKAFGFIKTQSFKVLEKKLVATKVDITSRTVMEFNNEPAVIAYARAVGVPAEKASDYFMHNPLGLMVSEEPYVRSPLKIEGNYMVFSCNIKQGMELSLLESTDIVAETQVSVVSKVKEFEGVSGIINFNCMLRTRELENKGFTKEYGEIFSNVPTVGFSTYGESFIGHINQTATMLIIK